MLLHLINLLFAVLVGFGKAVLAGIFLFVCLALLVAMGIRIGTAVAALSARFPALFTRIGYFLMWTFCWVAGMDLPRYRVED